VVTGHVPFMAFGKKCQTFRRMRYNYADNLSPS
jgi:hypothetical protein